MRYEVPTPIQTEVIPAVLEGKDIIGNAQTGTGKTAAFAIPLIHRMIGKPAGETRVLILVPTRELAIQIDENILGLAYHTNLKTAAVYGGVGMEFQQRALKGGSTFIVATPGRLLDHYKYGNWKFDKLDTLVLDEADRMLDMGFIPDLRLIVSRIPANRQTLLFSATMPEEIGKLARSLMKNPVQIKIGQATPPSAITQSFYPVDGHLKEKLLVHLLKETHLVSVIVFVGTKIGADRLARNLARSGFETGVIHGDREQAHRDQVINEFKSGLLKILVATDIAARGIDIDGISHVINYDMPFDAESYVHRIGRTARADAIGDAFTFVTPRDEELAAAIEKTVGKAIPRVEIRDFLPRPGSEHDRHDRHARPGPHRHPKSGRHETHRRSFHPRRRP